MSYDPNYYQQQSYAPTEQQRHGSQSYVPYDNRQLTQTRHSPQPAYPNSQSLAPYQPPSPGYDQRPSSRDGRYLSADDDDRHTRHRSRSRGHHSHRSKSRSRSRDVGAALLGAAAGGFLGHKYGGGALGTVGGALAGGVGANLAEKQYENFKEKREHRRRSGEYEREEKHGGLMGALLHPERALGRSKSKEREFVDDYEDDRERRHRHRHRHSGGSRSLSRGYYEEEITEKRRY